MKANGGLKRRPVWLLKELKVQLPLLTSSAAAGMRVIILTHTFMT